MNVKQLREWLQKLPPDFDLAEIQSTVHGMPSMAKRVIAYQWKDAKCFGVVVNSMGTHLSDEWFKDVVSTNILSA